MLFKKPTVVIGDDRAGLGEMGLYINGHLKYTTAASPLPSDLFKILDVLGIKYQIIHCDIKWYQNWSQDRNCLFPEKLKLVKPLRKEDLL